MNDIHVARKIEEIFMPHAFERTQQIQSVQGRFVHYTTAENALKIINSRKFWMRDARCMNDFSEVRHGFFQLQQFFADNEKLNAFKALLDSCGDGIGSEAFDTFNNRSLAHILQSTYIACLSEHDNSEDSHGRLSMWRSYGRGSAGVAVVMKLPLSENLSLPIFFSPVAYFDQVQVANEIERVVANIKTNVEFLRGLDRGIVVRSAIIMLMMATVSLKHQGFHEEREWRVIYFPSQSPSELIRMEVEAIGGIPQQVCKLSLKNFPDKGITGIEIPEILDRVIIGPSAYPVPIAQAFVSALQQAGVSDAAQRVVNSEIPLRT